MELLLLIKALLLLVLSDSLGFAIFGTRQNRSYLIPIFGLAIVFLLMLLLFSLGIPSILAFLLLPLAMYSLHKKATFRFWWRFLLRKAILFIITLVLAFLPYLTLYGRLQHVTGFIISNDAVVHAVLSTNCRKNPPAQEKILVFENEYVCLTGYPRAAHSAVNFFATYPAIEPSKIIALSSIIFYSFTVFALAEIVQSINRKNVKRKWNPIPYWIVPIITSTYFSLAIAYHGFLTQSAYIPLALAASIFIFSEKDKVFENKANMVMLAVAYAALVAVYSFVSVPVIFFLHLWAFFFSRKKVFTVIKASAVVVLLIILLLNVSVFVPFQWTLDVFLEMIGVAKGPVSEQTKSLGNLVGFLDMRMASGVWLEGDYRFVSKEGVLGDAYRVIATLVMFFTSFQLITMIKKRESGAIASIIPFLLSYLLVLVFTQSPYSVSKIQSLIFPYVPLLFTIFLFEKFPRAVAVSIFGFYTLLLLMSNFLLLKYISLLPFSVLDNLEALKDAIPEDSSVLFQTTNDWAVYYTDSEFVDIQGLHYLRDSGFQDVSSYSYVIKDGTTVFENSCTSLKTVGSYTICRQH